MNEVYARIILALQLMLDTCASAYQRQVFTAFCADTVQYAETVAEANRLIRDKVLETATGSQHGEAVALLNSNGFGVTTKRVTVRLVLDVENVNQHYKGDTSYFAANLISRLINEADESVKNDGKVRIDTVYDYSYVDGNKGFAY